MDLRVFLSLNILEIHTVSLLRGTKKNRRVRFHILDGTSHGISEMAGRLSCCSSIDYTHAEDTVDLLPGHSTDADEDTFHTRCASILDCLQRTVYPVLDQCYNLRGSVMNERGFLA